MGSVVLDLFGLAGRRSAWSRPLTLRRRRVSSGQVVRTCPMRVLGQGARRFSGRLRAAVRSATILDPGCSDVADAMACVASGNLSPLRHERSGMVPGAVAGSVSSGARRS